MRPVCLMICTASTNWARSHLFKVNVTMPAGAIGKFALPLDRLGLFCSWSRSIVAQAAQQDAVVVGGDRCEGLHLPLENQADSSRVKHYFNAYGWDPLPRGSYPPWGRGTVPVVRSRHPACTPALLGLFSLITIWVDGHAMPLAQRLSAAAWYRKQKPTFSDAIAAVRRVLWYPPDLSISRQPGEIIEIPAALQNQVFRTPCLAA